MADGSTLYNTWSTENSRDRAWFLLRKTLEQARLKYDLDLDGAVDVDQGNAQYMITFRNDDLKMGYFVSFLDISHKGKGPNYFLENSASPTLKEFADTLGRQARDKDMADFQWNREPVDVAWYLLRRVIEMADRRSDFKLTGRLSIESYHIKFIFEAYGLQSQFCLDKDVLTESQINPSDLAQEYGDIICRNFQKNLKDRADYGLDGLRKAIEQEKQAYGLAKRPRNTNQEYFKIGRQAREIEAARQAADESKLSFVIGKVFRISRIIEITCSPGLWKPLEKYGPIISNDSRNNYSWNLYVDKRYDFDLVLKVLRKIEAADDCVREYLRATCRKTDLVAWWDLDEVIYPRPVQDIYFDSHADAVAVMKVMKARIKDYGQVTIGDLYSLTGLRPALMDECYGWERLFGSYIVYVPDQGYLIHTRDPKKLS